jgi:uncharacterized membrane protein HdeD (DUF308 family)
VTQKFWWLNLVRGIVALIIGIVILEWFQTTHAFFVNFLAIYWLSSGLVSLQWGWSTHQKKGLWLVAGLLGVIVGAAILLRPLYQYALDPVLAVRIFGVLAVFVGLSRIFGRYTTIDMVHQRSQGSLFLGVFEAGLGLLLIFFDMPEPFTKLLAGGWAFLGGILLILQSLQLRGVKSTRT